MGKGKRFVLILLPQILTLVSIIFAITIILAGTNKNLSTNTYFLKVDTRFVASPSWLRRIPKKNSGWHHLKLQETPAHKSGVKDVYTVALWNQCEGKFSVNSKDKGVFRLQRCTKPNGQYFFDPVRLFASVPKYSRGNNIPKAILKMRKPIQGMTHAISFCFSVGLIANSTTFIIGWFGILSRVGSCIALVFSLIALSATLSAAGISTYLFSAIAETFKHTAHETGVNAAVSTRTIMLACSHPKDGGDQRSEEGTPS